MLRTAPDSVRELLSRRTGAALARVCTTLVIHPDLSAPEQAARAALRALALRWQQLDAEVRDHDRHITTLVDQINPALAAAFGVGPINAAQLLITAGDNPERLRSPAAFAALRGAAPVPASSSKTTRHRLSRGGDRQANAALHRICLCRMAWDPRTRAYKQRRQAQGRTNPEIMRCLKRYIARELWALLTHTAATPQPQAA